MRDVSYCLAVDSSRTTEFGSAYFAVKLQPKVVLTNNHAAPYAWSRAGRCAKTLVVDGCDSFDNIVVDLDGVTRVFSENVVPALELFTFFVDRRSPQVDWRSPHDRRVESYEFKEESYDQTTRPRTDWSPATLAAAVETSALHDRIVEARENAMRTEPRDAAGDEPATFLSSLVDGVTSLLLQQTPSYESTIYEVPRHAFNVTHAYEARNGRKLGCNEFDTDETTLEIYQSISCMPHYANRSFEELRLEDYSTYRRERVASPRGERLRCGRSRAGAGNKGCGALPSPPSKAQLKVWRASRTRRAPPAHVAFLRYKKTELGARSREQY